MEAIKSKRGKLKDESVNVKEISRPLLQLVIDRPKIVSSYCFEGKVPIWSFVCFFNLSSTDQK